MQYEYVIILLFFLSPFFVLHHPLLFVLSYPTLHPFTKLPLDLFPSDYIDVKSCCNHHDVCYGTCNSSRTECDTSFHSCMLQSCERWRQQNSEIFEVCTTSALILFKATQIHGCDVYKDFQSKACKCVNQGHLEL